jgi:hypothetical protein
MFNDNDEPFSAPSMENLRKQLSLRKVQVPEIWVTELEELFIKLGLMDSYITEYQFMIHELNNLTSEYEL